MYIVVNHDITNPEDFWASAQRILPQLPEGGVKRVITLFPNQAMDKCTCVWEADTIENLDKYLREKVGTSSRETYFELNEAASMGLND